MNIRQRTLRGIFAHIAITWCAARVLARRMPSELSSSYIVVTILALRFLFMLHKRVLDFFVRCSDHAQRASGVV
jgi:hypothetical protein